MYLYPGFSGLTALEHVTLHHIGHGFKLAPIVGKVLSEIALGYPPSYDLSPFMIDHFKTISLFNSFIINIYHTCECWYVKTSIGEVVYDGWKV